VSDEFLSIVEAVSALSYFERRKFLWTRVISQYPRFIYRYRPVDPENRWVDHLRDVLVRSQLWMSSPSDFNDPFDMNSKFEVGGDGRAVRARVKRLVRERAPGASLKERRRMEQKMMSNWPERLPEILEELSRQTLSRAGVCSFSDDPRSIQMWSHYASHHRGFALQFAVAGDPRTLFQALPVEYNNQYPTIDWVNKFEDTLMAVVLRKHPGWAYERERRIVLPSSARTQLPFRPEALAGIVFGCRVEDPTRKLVFQLLEERRRIGAPRVSLYAASKHPSEFHLCVQCERSK